MKRTEVGNRILAHFMKLEYSNELNYHEDFNKLLAVYKALPVIGDYRFGAIISSILDNDINEAWSKIVGYVNKYVLTQEEHLRFQNLINENSSKN